MGRREGRRDGVLRKLFGPHRGPQKRRLRDAFGTPKRPNIDGKGLEFHRNAYIMSYGHCFFQDFFCLFVVEVRIVHMKM